MEKRRVDFYVKQPSILRYCLKAKDEKGPEVLAITLAIVEKRNVTFKPEYRDKVFIHGQVGNPPESNPEIKADDWVETTPIESIYFEKVYNEDYADLHCYVVTKNTVYRLYDCEKNRLTWMHFLLEDIDERGLNFGDFTDYFSDINRTYKEVRIVT